MIHQAYTTVLAEISNDTGQKLADTLVAWLRPAVFIVVLALALFFGLQKQFSKVWTVIIIGAVIFMLSIGSGESSIIGKIAQFIYTLLS